MIKWYTYLLFVLMSNALFGQELSEEISEPHLSIGQPVIISYSIRTNSADSIVFHPSKQTIKGRAISTSGTLDKEEVDFEIIREFSDSTVLNNNEQIWIGKYTITVWDSGAYIIPGPRVYINDSVYEFDNLALACYLTDPIDGIDIYDIKENFIELPAPPFSFINFLKNWGWIILVGCLIIILILWINRKKQKTKELIKPLSLKERTLVAIESLEAAKLWEKDQLKEHFIELSFILRSYLTSRYEISLLEKTTNETKLLLAQKGLNEETVRVIAKILSQSDMVKFAKSKPDTISILNVSNLAKQIVAETSPIEFEHAE